MTYSPFSLYMISRQKAPAYDTCELFRATHSHNPIQYSHIVALTPHFFTCLQYTIKLSSETMRFFPLESERIVTNVIPFIILIHNKILSTFYLISSPMIMGII